MKSNYKRLGDYIRQLNERNANISVTDLQGINIAKEFMPSVANVIGTDLTTYKIVRKRQFAFNPMHVGRDGVLPINVLLNKDRIIVSPAYTVFEIIDENELNAEYLMMWFRRSEFDRNAWFTTDSSVRGGFGWVDFCDMKLPIPSIDKQKEIIKEYNILANRITLNNQLNQKLEETAQAIYKQWFVDFEFPDENRKPYKSNGGEMIESEMGEIPKGWKLKKIGELCDCNYATLSSNDKFVSIEYLDTSNITNNEINETQLLNLEADEIPSRAKRKVNHNDIIFSTVRPNLRHFGILINPKPNMIVSTGFAVLKISVPNLRAELIYFCITSEENLQSLQSRAEMSMSTYPSINPEDLMNIDYILPSKKILEKVAPFFKAAFELMDKKKKENKILNVSCQLLLQRNALLEYESN